MQKKLPLIKLNLQTRPTSLQMQLKQGKWINLDILSLWENDWVALIDSASFSNEQK